MTNLHPDLPRSMEHKTVEKNGRFWLLIIFNLEKTGRFTALELHTAKSLHEAEIQSMVFIEWLYVGLNLTDEQRKKYPEHIECPIPHRKPSAKEVIGLCPSEERGFHN
jgi:hypothetical protein